MNRSSRALAIGTFVISTFAFASAIGLVVAGHTPLGSIDGDIPFVALLLLWGGLGLVLAIKVPRNPIGWILCGVASIGEASFLAFAYGAAPDAPGRAYGAWFATWTGEWIPAFFIVMILLLFPSGHLETRLDRVAAAAISLLTVVGTAAVAFDGGRLPHHDLPNPFGVEALENVSASILDGLNLLLTLVFVTSFLSMLGRFRRSTRIGRQQLKWFFFATGLLAFDLIVASVATAAGVDTSVGNFIGAALALLAMAGLGLGITIAILRYRLYEIDVLINRALVYASLTALIVVSYLALVFSLQLVLDPITQDSDLAVAASTLAVAALFRPFRARIQAFIDRRFYRRKYDAALMLDHLARRLRDEVELETVRSDVLMVVHDTVQPSHASLWTRPAR